jgi:hypothetical protein
VEVGMNLRGVLLIGKFVVVTKFSREKVELGTE